MSAKESGLILGGEPRIDFLPGEIKARKDARRTRRFLAVVVVLVAMACVASYVFASNLTLQSKMQLEDAQARTADLLQQQMEFAEVRTMSNRLDSVRDARLVASATEVLWTEYLRELQGKLPAGATVVAYTVDSQSALEAVLVPDTPLQTPKVATITLTVTVPSLSEVEVLLINLSSITGYAGATVTTATLDEAEGETGYSANVILNVNSEAFAKRFYEQSDEPAATPDETVEGDTE